jgi:CheY-like chemotaxis protein
MIRIVVVDDNDVDRYLVQRAIDASNLDAELFQYDAGDRFIDDVIDAGKRLTAFGPTPPPIMVLLDINMPRMTGLEVLDKLKHKMGTDQVVIVTMYSSSRHAQDRADAMKYDFVKYFVVKPITAEALESLADRVFCAPS